METARPLFVYGTLRPAIGHPLGLALASAGSDWGMGSVAGLLYDQGEYPVAVPSTNEDDRIIGELWCLPPQHNLWRELDAYEDYDPESPQSSAFVRRPVTAMLGCDDPIEAQIYWFRLETAGMKRLYSGNYLRRDD